MTNFRLPNPDQTLLGRVSNDLRGNNKERGRALPDSKGGETPKQLATYYTQIFTFFTDSSEQSQLLYSAENWVKITLKLETAGPVAIGTDANIVPVLAGSGVLLDTVDPFVFSLAKGTRVYITSQTVNRVTVIIEPIPWLEQLDLDLVQSVRNLQHSIELMGAQFTAAIAALQSGQQVPHAPPPAAPPTRMGVPGGSMRPSPLAPGKLPPRGIQLPRLTGKR